MKKLVYIITLFIMVSCAQQSLLTGGDKDIKAPVLNEEKTIPVNFSTNFNSKVIQLYFDEYVQLKDAKNNFFVNPTIENIRLEEKGKSILVHIEEPLEKNTTYTFNFGASIEDITENNPTVDFKYVLSTGSYIDSTFYRGCVFDAFTKKPLENVKVLLYENKLDSLTEKASPNYLCTTNEAGNFKLDNLKEGNYFVLAIEDKNKNNLPDPKNEKVAYRFDLVNSLMPGDSISKDSLLLFMHDNPLKVIDKSYTPPGKFNVVFNKKIASSNIKIDSLIYFVEPKKSKSDTFSFWIDSLSSASLDFQLNIEEELYAKALKINTYTSSAKDSTYSYRTNINNLRPATPLKLFFNHPIKKVNAELIHFSIDSIKTDFIGAFDGTIWSLELPVLENNTLELMAEPGAFESIYGIKSDTIDLMFKQKSQSSYGDLYMNINCRECDQFIVELISNDALVETFICNTPQLIDTVTLCDPGNYQLRLINDLNNDGEWTTGDFRKKTQPEPVYYYNEPMVIKSGWSLDLEWIIQ